MEPEWLQYICLKFACKRNNSFILKFLNNVFLVFQLKFTTRCLSLQLSDIYFFACGPAIQRGSWPPHSWGFLDHTQRRTTVGRSPLDEWSARRTNLYLTTLTTDKHPCPQWKSNPRSQQASGRRPTP